MADLLGPVSGLHGLHCLTTPLASSHGRSPPGIDGGPDFKHFLREQIERLGDLQSDATRAVKDLAAGRRSDIDGVTLTTQQADHAWQMLLQLRNAALSAYDEIRQIRV